MREIKFRAWDVINKKMYPVAFPTWNGAVEGKIDFVNHAVEMIDEDGDDKPILMQWTGLLDRQGEEIYEGDVLCWPKYEGTKNQTRWIVEWEKEKAMFTQWHPIMDAEVIGNIYENGELLS